MKKITISIATLILSMNMNAQANIKEWADKHHCSVDVTIYGKYYSNRDILNYKDTTMQEVSGGIILPEENKNIAFLNKLKDWIYEDMYKRRIAKETAISYIYNIDAMIRKIELCQENIK